MRVTVLPDAASAARAAADSIAGTLRDDLASRGAATCAFSGGSTPRAMLAALGAMTIDWTRLQVFQVDERVAPAGDAARNLGALQAGLVALPPSQLHAMPVGATDVEAAAREYAAALARHAGVPPRLDLVHLGLGDDGHTASLFDGDPALACVDREVVITGVQRGHRRMTLTAPVLVRARRRVWLACGADKAVALAALVRALTAGGRRDAAAHAGGAAARVAQPGDLLFADVAAARDMR